MVQRHACFVFCRRREKSARIGCVTYIIRCDASGSKSREKKNTIVASLVREKKRRRRRPTVEAVVRGEKFLCRRRSHDDDE